MRQNRPTRANITRCESFPPAVNNIATADRAITIALAVSGWRKTIRVALPAIRRSEEHTSELQSQSNLVCRLLLEKNQIEQRFTKVKHPWSNANEKRVVRTVV